MQVEEAAGPWPADVRGEGLHVDGLEQISRVSYPRRPTAGHEHLGGLVPLGVGTADVTLAALLERAEAALGPGACLDLSRDVIVRLTCPACGHASPGRAVLGAVRESDAACPACRAHRVVEIASSISRDGDVDLAQTPADLGCRRGRGGARAGLEAQQAWWFDGDAARVLGPLAGAARPQGNAT
jgi:hypothetical protein